MTEELLLNSFVNVDWGLTAFSAQIGYIVPLISMLQFKK